MSDSYFDWLASSPAKSAVDGLGGSGPAKPAAAIDFAFDSINAANEFSARMTLKNLGNRNIQRWKLEFDFAGRISDVPGARLVGFAGKRYTMVNLETGAGIPAGGNLHLRLKGTLTLPNARPENCIFNGVRVNDRWQHPTGSALRAQLQRLLATRPPPLPVLKEHSEAQADSLFYKHDRLITYGFELPARAAVNEKQDRELLQERVNQCIKRHLPWAAQLAVVTNRDGDRDAGRAVVSVQIRVGASAERNSLELTLDRLARDVELICEP